MHVEPTVCLGSIEDSYNFVSCMLDEVITFCDIVVMNGRVPRTKAPSQVVRELDALHRRGWRDMVFIRNNFV